MPGVKFGDFFRREWVCNNPFPHTCTVPFKTEWDEWSTIPPGHESCGWRYTASINEYDFESLKDARLTK